MERRPGQTPSINEGTGKPGGQAGNEPSHLYGYQSTLKDESKGLIQKSTEKSGCLAAIPIVIKLLIKGDNSNS